jgi:hypothetical protein
LCNHAREDGKPDEVEESHGGLNTIDLVINQRSLEELSQQEENKVETLEGRQGRNKKNMDIRAEKSHRSTTQEGLFGEAHAHAEESR